MATVETPREQKVVVKEMSWDPITRIVGSLGIHIEIDFSNQQVLKCHSTSMIFRGFDIFMKGIDPRDAHFITSRICVICGDNHCTCSCLNQNMAFGGPHTHPSTILPGGCSADITPQTLSDYYVRLMSYFDYVKRVVPMHDDLYDFFLQELPGYDMVGYRETNLVNWGSFDDPDYVDYDYRNMTEWGRKRYITPGVAIGGELISTDLVEINLMIRILPGPSYFDPSDNEPPSVD